jgi:hypothetical protein
MQKFTVKITADDGKPVLVGVEANDALTAIAIAKFKLYQEICDAKKLVIEAQVWSEKKGMGD